MKEKLTKFKVAEKDIQRAILEWLSLKKIFHYRNNSGAFKGSRGQFYKFGSLGSPDIIGIIKGQYVGIEVKGSNGKGKQSEAQKKFQEDLENAGGRYILTDSLEELIKWITLLI